MHNSDCKLRNWSERRYIEGSRERYYICKRGFMEEHKRMRGQGIIVCKATRLWSVETRVWIPVGWTFVTSRHVQTGFEAIAASTLMGIRVLSQGKVAGAWWQLTPPSNVEVETEESFTSNPSLCLHDMYGTNIKSLLRRWTYQSLNSMYLCWWVCSQYW